MAEISLICEENLLDTIFFACDTQRRGTDTLTCTDAVSLQPLCVRPCALWGFFRMIEDWNWLVPPPASNNVCF